MSPSTSNMKVRVSFRESKKNTTNQLDLSLENRNHGIKIASNVSLNPNVNQWWNVGFDEEVRHPSEKVNKENYFPGY